MMLADEFGGREVLWTWSRMMKRTRLEWQSR